MTDSARVYLSPLALPTQSGITLHSPCDTPGEFIWRYIRVPLAFGLSYGVKGELIGLERDLERSGGAHLSPSSDLARIELA
jgi:hypothetical protein